MRQHNKALRGLSHVLGFYVNGIPAIFLGADIVLGLDPALREYRSFSSGGLPFPSGDLRPRLLTGFEAGATLIHELRHFHDALLSRSLFMLFVLRASMNWTTLQLLGRWRHEMPALLPVPLKTAAKRATGEMAGLLQQLLKATARYSELERRFYSPITLKGNTRLTARDLLETNAVLAELFTLHVDHGIDIAEQYYQEIVKRSNPEYWRLMEFAIERCGDFRRALFGLHFVVSASLWMGDHPVKTFVELFASLSPATANKISNSDS